MHTVKQSPLTLMAKRFENNRDFMAWVLAQYRQHEGLTEEELLAELGITEPLLGRLAMCKRPLTDPAQFASQVQQIASYTQIEAHMLAKIVRLVDSLARFAQRPQPDTSSPQSTRSWQPTLAAARDHDEEEE